MSDLETRIGKLEKINGGITAKQAEANFWLGAREVAKHFPAEAANWTEVDFMGRPLFQYVGWLLRFRGEADLAEVNRFYGWGGVPTTSDSWTMFASLLPCDACL